MKEHVGRRALLALPGFALLVGCQTAAELPVVAPPQASGLAATLTTTLPARVPLQTALALRYGAASSGFGSIFTVASSGQVMRLFENRPIAAGRLADFPTRADPVIRFGQPAGAETCILIVTMHPFRGLAPTDFADNTPFARLTLDPGGFESRLAAALATLPAGSYAVQRLTITTF